MRMLGADIADNYLINFKFPKCRQENEIVWLLGNYIAKVWSELSVKAVDAMKLEEFFGFLTFKYKEDQQGARYPLNHIPGL